MSETTQDPHDQIWHNLQPSTQNAVAEFQLTLDGAFTGFERQQVEDALWLMCEVHADQKARPDGTPYPEHPLGVAASVLSNSEVPDSEQIVSALLHDTVEDQSAKLAAKAIEIGIMGDSERALALGYIEAQFGGRVAHIVSELTNPLVAPSQQITAEGKNILYREHVRGAIQDPDVLPIKLADFSANALRLDELGDHDRRLKLTRKYEPVVSVFIDRLTNGQPTGIKPEVQAQLVTELTQARADMQAWLQAQDT